MDRLTCSTAVILHPPRSMISDFWLSYMVPLTSPQRPTSSRFRCCCCYWLWLWAVVSAFTAATTSSAAVCMVTIVFAFRKTHGVLTYSSQHLCMAFPVRARTLIFRVFSICSLNEGTHARTNCFLLLRGRSIFWV